MARVSTTIKIIVSETVVLMMDRTYRVSGSGCISQPPQVRVQIDNKQTDKRSILLASGRRLPAEGGEKSF